MAQRKTLTEDQVEILRWIANGCPPGVLDGHSHRISAAALRTRGLVAIRGRGTTWRATITPAGSEYLDRVNGPNPPPPRRPSGSVTEQLVDELIAAGGRLVLPRKRWNEPDQVDYAHRARLAQRHGKVPAGKRLKLALGDSTVELHLEDVAGGVAACSDLRPVAVPARVGRYDPVARAFRDQPDRHEVSRQSVARATRIIHAIALEARRLGWQVDVPKATPNGHGHIGWTGTKDGHVRINVDGHVFWLRLQEAGVRTRLTWQEEVAQHRARSRLSLSSQNEYAPLAAYDFEASGDLKLTLHDAKWWIYRGRRSRWSDGKRAKLEAHLQDVFREIHERVLEVQEIETERRLRAERAVEEARRQAEERELQWQELMSAARDRAAEAHRERELLRQVKAGRDAEDIRRYCDAVEAAHPDAVETAHWIEWARAYARKLDPVSRPPTMRPVPAFAPDDLQPHLPAGWSALGPHEEQPSKNQPIPRELSAFG